jgi:hypothetical protein
MDNAEHIYHVQIILDFEYSAKSEEHAQTLAANHIATSLRLGPPMSRKIRLKCLGGSTEERS